MKRDTSAEFVRDVEELLEEAVLAEASHAVWKAFQSAFRQLDAESQRLLELHFSGKDTKELAATLDLPTEEVEAWILKSKREIMATVGRKATIRQ